MTPTPGPGILLRVWHPVTGSEVPSDAVVVVGLTDADSTVTLNGRIVTVDRDGRFQAEAFLSPGPNIIRVVAISRNGNQASSELTVTSLALPPQPFVLLVAEPADQSVTQDRSVRLAGRTTPNAEVTVNGVQISVDPLLGIFETKVALLTGPNIIRVVASVPEEGELTKVIAVIRRPASRQ